MQAGDRRLPVKKRCSWAGTDPLYLAYHDREWGLPVHRDRRLFEMLVLEGAQAGLSWLTILKKRQNYRNAFSGFDFEKVARFDRRKVARLLEDPGIVRNRAKVEAAVRNARVVLEIRTEFRSFNRFCWQFVDGAPIVNRWKTTRSLPARTERSEAMSKELLRRGMKFVGPTICYAFMQATGMVNDHVVECFRYTQLGGKLRRV